MCDAALRALRTWAIVFVIATLSLISLTAYLLFMLLSFIWK